MNKILRKPAPENANAPGKHAGIFGAAFLLYVLLTFWAAVACGQSNCCPTPVWQQPGLGQQGRAGGRCPVPQQRPPAVTQPARSNPAVCRVRNIVRGEHNLGSGTYVEGDIVLTCWHTFSDGVGQVAVRFPGGEFRAVRVLAVSRTWDLAALKITDSQPRPVPVTISATAPKPGDVLTSCGYGKVGRYWCSRGRAKGYCAPSKESSDFEILEITGRSRQGDSGGPILNGCGELVAVLFGSDQKVVAGTHCGRIRRWLRRILPGRLLPDRPVVPVIHPPDVVAPPADSTAEDIKSLYAKIAALHKLIAAIEAKPGPRGPPGKDGKDGIAGKDGVDGEEGAAGSPGQPAAAQELDYEMLADGVVARLPPITVKTTKDGKVVDVVEVPLGGTLHLNLIPVSGGKR